MKIQYRLVVGGESELFEVQYRNLGTFYRWWPKKYFSEFEKADKYMQYLEAGHKIVRTSDWI